MSENVSSGMRTITWTFSTIMYVNLLWRILSRLFFVRTDDNDSDIFTKNVNGMTYKRLAIKVLMDKDKVELNDWKLKQYKGCRKVLYGFLLCTLYVYAEQRSISRHEQENVIFMEFEDCNIIIVTCYMCALGNENLWLDMSERMLHLWSLKIVAS